MFKNNNYEMLIDISNIKSAYQAGHSHADTFNFILHIDKTLYSSAVLQHTTYEELHEDQLKHITR